MLCDLDGQGVEDTSVSGCSALTIVNRHFEGTSVASLFTDRHGDNVPDELN